MSWKLPKQPRVVHKEKGGFLRSFHQWIRKVAKRKQKLERHAKAKRQAKVAKSKKDRKSRKHQEKQERPSKRIKAQLKNGNNKKASI